MKLVEQYAKYSKQYEFGVQRYVSISSHFSMRRTGIYDPVIYNIYMAYLKKN